MATSLGQVVVDIVGDAEPLADDLNAALDSIGESITEELSGAFDGVTDSLSEDFAEAGVDAGSSLVDGVEGEVSTLEVDASGAFDAVSAEAADAADSAAAAFDGVGEEIESSLSSAFGGVSESLGTLKGALGTAAGGAGLERFARAQFPLTEQSRRLADALDLNEDRVRELAIASADVTRPLDQVLNTMEIGRQQGLRNEEQLMDFVAAWDTVGDATGLGADQLAKLSPSLAAVGIEAHEVEQAFSAFGFMTENTTMDVGDFLSIVNRMGPDLREMNMDVDDTAAVLGAMQGELGLTGRIARTEFRKAINDAEGDMGTMLETLGLSEEQFAEYRNQVDESSHIIARNAEFHADSYTLMQRGQHVVETLMFRFGGLADAASLVAGPLGAVGPVMLGINQSSEVLGKALPALGRTFASFGKLLLANPLFLVGALLVGVIAAVWHFRDEILAALQPVLDWLSDTLGPVFERFAEIAQDVFARVQEFAAAAAEWFLGHVWPLIQSFADLFLAIWERVSQVFGAVWDVIRRHLDVAWAAIRVVLDALLEAWRFLWRMVQAAWSRIGPPLLSIISTGFEQMRDTVSTVFDVVKTVIETVLGVIRGIVDTVTAVIRGDWDAAFEAIQGITETVSNAIERIIGNLAAWFRRTIERLVSTVVGFFTGLRDDVLEAVGRLRDRVTEFITETRDNFVERVTELVDDAVQFFLDLPDRVLDAVSGFGELLFDAGRDLIGGLVSGITDRVQSALDTIRNVGSEIASAARSALRIGSPSMLFAEEVGGPITEGIAVGIRDSASDALDEIERFANTASSDFTMAVNGGGAAPGVASERVGASQRSVTVFVQGEVRPIDEERLATLLRRQERLEGVL